MYQYKAKILECLLIADKDNINIHPSNVLMIKIDKDYDNKLSPIIMVDLNVPNAYINKIYAASSKLSMKLNMIEIATSGTDGNLDRIPLFSKTFSVVIHDDETEHRLSNKTDVSNQTVTDSEPSSKISLYLIDTSILDRIQTSKEVNISKASMAMLINHALSSRGFNSGTVICTPPVNTKIYSHIMYPTHDLRDTLDNFNKEYGIYKHEITLFSDIDYLYILDKSNPNITLVEPMQYGQIEITMQGQTSGLDSFKSGSMIDTKSKTHIINVSQLPDIQNLEDHIGRMNYSNIMSFDKSSANVNRSKTADSGKKVQYISSINSLKSEQIKNSIKGNTKNVSVIVDHASMNIVRPYKTFKFSMDSELSNYDYSGNFRASRVSYILESDGSGMFTIKTSLELKKI